jgi:hypothetical protein
MGFLLAWASTAVYQICAESATRATGAAQIISKQLQAFATGARQSF